MGRLIDEEEVLILVSDRIGNDYIVRNIKKLPAVDVDAIKEDMMNIYMSGEAHREVERILDRHLGRRR